MNALNRTVFRSFILAWLCQAIVSPLCHAAPRVPLPLPSDALATCGWDTPFFLVPMESQAINEDKAVLLESWSGYSLLRDSLSTTTPVAIPALNNNGTTNLTAAQGTVRFWISPNWTTASENSDGTGPGHL